MQGNYIDINHLNNHLSSFIIFYILTLTIIIAFLLNCKKYVKHQKKYKESNKDTNIPNTNKDIPKDPFVLSFRKTRTESLILSRVEEIQKDRYIQFLVSCYYYNNDSSIKGCVYVVTSKVLYKIFFIKNSIICKDIHRFSSFVYSYNKQVYDKINNYLSSNSNLEKQKHHLEFFTWPHYYIIDNYIKETESIENFFKTL